MTICPRDSLFFFFNRRRISTIGSRALEDETYHVDEQTETMKTDLGDMKELLERYDNFLLDVDGTVQAAGTPLPNLPATLRALARLGKRLF